MNKTFNDFGIDVRGMTSGEARTTCPQCSLQRRKALVRCLAVNVTEGCWLCFHCGWAGGLQRSASAVDSHAIEQMRRQADAERKARYAANRSKVDQLWRSTLPVRATDPVGLYLRRRSLRLDLFPTDLRYSPTLPYFDDDGAHLGDFPAMVAAVRDERGALTAVHRTYLSEEGYKAPVDPVKKLSIVCGPVSGAAVRLASVRNGELGIAEGVETALAAAMGSGIPVWSAVSASGLRAFQWPARLRRLVIFADNDENGTGQQAAASLYQRAQAFGIACKTMIPPRPGDWLDVWAAGQMEAA